MKERMTKRNLRQTATRQNKVGMGIKRRKKNHDRNKETKKAAMRGMRGRKEGRREAVSYLCPCLYKRQEQDLPHL